MEKVVVAGLEVDFDAAVNLMDDETREEVHSAFSGQTKQDFVDQYAVAHRAKFGKDFVVN